MICGVDFCPPRHLLYVAEKHHVCFRRTQNGTIATYHSHDHTFVYHQAKNLVSKDEAEKRYKKRMDKLLSKVSARTGVEPGDLERAHRGAHADAVSHFEQAANFGKREEIDSAREELVASLAELWEGYQKVGGGVVAGYVGGFSWWEGIRR